MQVHSHSNSVRCLLVSPNPISFSQPYFSSHFTLAGTIQKIGPFDIEIHSIDDATREFFERLGCAQEQTSDALLRGPSLPFPLSIQELHAQHVPRAINYPELPFGLGEAEGDDAGTSVPKVHSPQFYDQILVLFDGGFAVDAVGTEEGREEAA